MKLALTGQDAATSKAPSRQFTAHQVMMLIVNGEPATLAPATPATDAFREFLRVTLIKDPAYRPSAAQLLQHEWIRAATRAPLHELVAAQEQQLLQQTAEAPPAEAEDSNVPNFLHGDDSRRRSSDDGATMKL